MRAPLGPALCHLPSGPWGEQRKQLPAPGSYFTPGATYPAERLELIILPQEQPTLQSGWNFLGFFRFLCYLPALPTTCCGYPRLTKAPEPGQPPCLPVGGSVVPGSPSIIQGTEAMDTQGMVKDAAPSVPPSRSFQQDRWSFFCPHCLLLA